MTTYHINYNTGAGNFSTEGDLDDAKAQADEGATYTQQPIEITDDDGNTVSRRPWYGTAADPDDEDDIVEFGSYGFYDAWRDK